MAEKTLVMGIINLTPDSFCDGGEVDGPEAAVARARQMMVDGADILDIGGESSRPGAEPVSIEVECARVIPALEALRPHDYRISVDTYHAETARRALACGAAMINDISALRSDPGMAEVIASARCECVLMHMLGSPRTMQDAPRYGNVIDDLLAFFEERIDYAVRAGIHEHTIWIDPGFGFGKTVEHNLEIIRQLHAFKALGRPVLVGVSNKSTIGALLGGAPVEERMEGTAAAIAVAIANGADCVRVHDVKAMARVAKVADAIVRA